jgi:hypothetical protein
MAIRIAVFIAGVSLVPLAGVGLTFCSVAADFAEPSLIPLRE